MIPGDSSEDRVGVGGPYEWLGVFVPPIDVIQRRLLQGRLAREHASPQLLLRQVGEHALDQVEPAGARGREVQVVARMTFEPALHRRGFVRRVVVHHEVNARIGRFRLTDDFIDGLEELVELLVPMPRLTFADHHASLHHQRREEAARAVSNVVVRASLHLPARHRQQRLRALQRLHLALLIHAQHHRVLRRTHVQAHDVTHLLNEVRITRELERLGPVRLPVERPPDGVHARSRDPRRRRHQAQTPVRRIRRHLFKRLAHDPGDLLVSDLPLHARARLVLQTRNAVLDESVAPLEHRLLTHVQLRADRGIGQALFIEQNDLAARRQPVRRARPPREPLKIRPLHIRDRQCRSRTHPWPPV